eukprot:s3429_g3.t1
MWFSEGLKLATSCPGLPATVWGLSVGLKCSSAVDQKQQTEISQKMGQLAAKTSAIFQDISATSAAHIKQLAPKIERSGEEIQPKTR